MCYLIRIHFKLSPIQMTITLTLGKKIFLIFGKKFLDKILLQ